MELPFTPKGLDSSEMIFMSLWDSIIQTINPLEMDLIHRTNIYNSKSLDLSSLIYHVFVGPSNHRQFNFLLQF